MTNASTPTTPARRLDDKVFAYFGAGRVTVAETFTAAGGWTRWTRYRKGITYSWARKLRAAGVTTVALTDGRRVADFPLAELLGSR